MKKQKVMSQVKGQDKTPEKQLNEVETGNLLEKEFRIMIMKMIQDLGKTMKKIQEMFTKDLGELKNKQAEGDEREKGPEKIFEEIIAENFLNIRKEIVR